MFTQKHKALLCLLCKCCKRVLKPQWKPIVPPCSTTGADAVHLSAGAEDGNGVRCQVEHCPGSISRWVELQMNLLHASAERAIKVWPMVPWKHRRCSGWPTLFLAGAACRDTLTALSYDCVSAQQVDPPAWPLTLRTRILRPSSPSARQGLWETTACASRASPNPRDSPPLLHPQERQRGAQLSSTSRRRWRHRTRPALTQPRTARIRWDTPVIVANVRLWSWNELHCLADGENGAV